VLGGSKSFLSGLFGLPCAIGRESWNRLKWEFITFLPHRPACHSRGCPTNHGTSKRILFPEFQKGCKVSLSADRFSEILPTHLSPSPGRLFSVLVVQEMPWKLHPVPSNISMFSEFLLAKQAKNKNTVFPHLPLFFFNISYFANESFGFHNYSFLWLKLGFHRLLWN
jgi:hypothetical protein